MGCASSVEGTHHHNSNSANDSPRLHHTPEPASPKKTIGDEVNDDESPLMPSKLAPAPGEPAAVGAAHNIRKLNAFTQSQGGDDSPARAVSPNPLQKPSQNPVSDTLPAEPPSPSPTGTAEVLQPHQGSNKLTDSGNNYNSNTEYNITRNDVDVTGINESSSGEFEMPEEQCAEQVPIAVASPDGGGGDSDEEYGHPVDHGAFEKAPIGNPSAVGIGARAAPFAMPSSAPSPPKPAVDSRFAAAQQAAAAHSAKATSDMLDDFEKEFSQPVKLPANGPKPTGTKVAENNNNTDFDALHRMLDQPKSDHNVYASKPALVPPMDNYEASKPLTGSFGSDFSNTPAVMREPQPPKEPQPSQLPIRSHSGATSPQPPPAATTLQPAVTSPPGSPAKVPKAKGDKKDKKKKKQVIESSSSSSDSESVSEPSENDSDDDAPKRPKGKAAQAAAAIALKRVRAKKKKEKEKKRAAKKAAAEAAAATKGEDSDDD